MKLDDTGIREAYHAEDASTWALALIGAARPVRDRVIEALDTGPADDLRRRLALMGPYRLDDSESAQADLAERMRRLHDHGQITLPDPQRSGGHPCLTWLTSKIWPNSTRTTCGRYFGQVTSDEILDALAGSTPGIRRQLLTKLVPSSAASMEASLLSHGPVSFEAVQTAQRTLVEALCRLSRGGQVAFDDPADMEMVA